MKIKLKTGEELTHETQADDEGAWHRLLVLEDGVNHAGAWTPSAEPARCLDFVARWVAHFEESKIWISREEIVASYALE